jgi:hypothetical protein
MRLKLRGIGVLLVLGGLATTADAQSQTTPFFRMDCGTNGSNWPQCGFDVSDTSATQYYRRTRVPAGSPSGSDAVQFDFIPTTATNLDFGYGWALSRASALPPAPQGQARYIRYRVRVLSPLNAMNNSDSRWASKLVILGNNCESGTHQPTRVIGFLDTGGNSDYTRMFTRAGQNIGPSSVNLPLALGQWMDIQIKAQSSSAASATDGYVALYVNNNNEATPTGRSPNISLRTSGWSPSTCPASWMAFGSSAREIRTGAVLAFQLADFEYDDAFDPNWDIGGGSGQSGPAAPQGLRILSSGAVGVLPIGAVLSLLGFRLRRLKPVSQDGK